MSELPLITSGDQIDAHDGQQVRLVGTYRVFDPRMRRRGPPRDDGFVVIALEDGVEVHLEPMWAEGGKRADDERSSLTGTVVTFEGSLAAIMPEGEIPVAQPQSPCLVDASLL